VTTTIAASASRSSARSAWDVAEHADDGRPCGGERVALPARDLEHDHVRAGRRGVDAGEQGGGVGRDALPRPGERRAPDVGGRRSVAVERRAPDVRDRRSVAVERREVGGDGLAPAHTVQRQPAGRRRAQQRRVDGPADERVDAEHRGARLVGGGDRDPVALHRDADPQRRGAAVAVAPDAGPRERQHDLVGAGLPEPALAERRVQGGVEQRRMHAVPRRVGAERLVEDDVGEQDVAAAVDGARAPERRAVVEPDRGELVVERGGVDDLRVARRPDPGELGERGRGRAVLGGRLQQTGRVPRPGAVGVVRRAAVHLDGAPAVVGGGADRDLEVDGGVAVEDQRRLQRQLVEHVAPERRAGVQGELDERRSGKQDGPEDRMVGQPAVRADRDAAGEQVLVAAGDAGRRAQERVVAAVQAGGAHVAGAGARVEPVALPVEGIAGQLDAFGAREQPREVDVKPRRVRVARGTEEALQPPSSRRRLVATTASTSAASTVCSSASSSTGCGVSSTNVRTPSASSASAA
jgi:hypothetical protein